MFNGYIGHPTTWLLVGVTWLTLSLLTWITWRGYGYTGGQITVEQIN